jgi:catechol 2,3-dioxygenase-like lactoylglutathione lyase family enzyme
MNMKLEVVIVPVSDVDRAKAFYEKLGFRLDIDIVSENFRGIQFTPPQFRGIDHLWQGSHVDQGWLGGPSPRRG